MERIRIHGCLGISEIIPGVFDVITFAFVNGSFVKTSGVNSIREFDMKPFSVDAAGIVSSNATILKLVNIESADILNGMTTLDSSKILVWDVHIGLVYKVNRITGAYYIVINDSLMNLGPNASTNLSVNGIRIRDSYLYWTNAAVGSLNRIKTNVEAEPRGTSEAVAANAPKAGDFIFKSDGMSFIAWNQEDELSVCSLGIKLLTCLLG